MSQKVNIDLVTINSKQAENSAKTLKQRIKELKDELSELNLESDEAKAKMAELGDLMHTQSEITELARLKSSDYGDTLASVTKATAGLVGGISAVNSVMTLMGVNSSDTAKSLQTMTALMALVQSLSTLDTAEKSWRALYEKIRNAVVAKKLDAEVTEKQTEEQIKNTTAVNQNTIAQNKNNTAIKQGASGISLFKNGVKSTMSALKGFVVANPFTLIITTLTTAITLISTFVNKAKEARLDAEKATTEYMKNIFSNVFDASNINFDSSYISIPIIEMREDIDNVLKKTKKAIKGEEVELVDENAIARYKQFYKDYLEFQEKRNESLKEYTKLSKEEKETEEGKRKHLEYLANEARYRSTEVGYLRDYIILTVNALKILEEGSDEYNARLEKYNEGVNQLETAYQATITAFKKLEEFDKAQEKKKEEDEKKADEDKKKAREDFYAKQLNDLKTSLTNQQLELELSYKKREISEKEYLDKSLELNKWYYGELEKIKYNPNITKADMLQAEANIVSSENNKYNYQIQQIREKQIKEIDTLVVDERKRIENDIETLQQTILLNNAKILNLQGKSLREQVELLKQADNESKEEKIAHINDMLAIDIDYYNEQMKINKENYNNEKQYQIDVFNREKEALQKELETIKNDTDKKIQETKIQELEEEHKKQLETLKSEFELSYLDLEYTKTQITAEASQARYDIEKAEIEKRLELQEKYVEAYQNIYSGLSGLIGEIQSGYDSNSKEYKNIQKTMIIADTITASMSAYKSGIQSGLIPPYNMVYGGVLASIATATGIAQLKNLENETITTTSAVNNVTNTNPYETLSYATLSNIEGNITDTKVYVVESELQAVSKSVSIYESEATF